MQLYATVYVLICECPPNAPQLKDALDKITYTEELLVRARSEVERLTPLEARCRVLAGQVEDLGEELKGARDAMAAAKQDAAALAAQVRAIG